MQTHAMLGLPPRLSSLKVIEDVDPHTYYIAAKTLYS